VDDEQKGGVQSSTEDDGDAASPSTLYAMSKGPDETLQSPRSSEGLNERRALQRGLTRPLIVDRPDLKPLQVFFCGGGG